MSVSRLKNEAMETCYYSWNACEKLILFVYVYSYNVIT